MTWRRPAATSLAVALALAVGGCGGAEAPELTAAAPATSSPAPAPTTTPSASASVGPTAPVTASPTPEAGPAVMAASAPVRLQVPTIGVDSELMELGLLADGTLEVPPGAFPAGWYTGAPTPGELGPAVIAGHVDWVTGPGVFYDLADLAVGAEIRVARADGSVAVFAVTAVEEYPKDEFPTALVYGDLDHAGLRLITCGGAWNPATQHYEANIVAFAELVGAG